MASKVEIANRALTKLGEDRILSLADDTKAARTLNSMFDIVRDAELRRSNWNFAVSRAQLAASTTDPEWGFGYAYPLPADFLKLLDIDGSWSCPAQTDYVTYDNSIFRIENVADVGSCIVTDLAAPLKIRYTMRATDTAKYDPAFVEALACRLAIEACETLTQSGTKKQAAMVEYRMAINEAITANAVENPARALADDSWIRSRL